MYLLITNLRIGNMLFHNIKDNIVMLQNFKRLLVKNKFNYGNISIC